MALTKQIKTKKYLEENCHVYEVNGELYAKGPKGERKLSPKLCRTKHKYGKTLEYYLVSLIDYETKKQITWTLQQLLYTWFIGDIPVGYDVDHIDRNSLNNNLDNLQILTRKENLAKRTGFKVNVRIYCIELNKEYDSMTSAIKELGVTQWYVYQTLKGNNPKKAKYHFRYAGE